jgi:hypothetical protein
VKALSSQAAEYFTLSAVGWEELRAKHNWRGRLVLLLLGRGET